MISLKNLENTIRNKVSPQLSRLKNTVQNSQAVGAALGPGLGALVGNRPQRQLVSKVGQGIKKAGEMTINQPSIQQEVVKRLPGKAGSAWANPNKIAGDTVLSYGKTLQSFGDRGARAFDLTKASRKSILDFVGSPEVENVLNLGDAIEPTGIPLIPFAGTIAGLNAKSFLGKQGDDLAQEILKTGAYSDIKDRGLRFFIPDNYAKLNRRVFDKLTKSIDETGQVAETTLGTFLKHDELYKEYPQAKDIRLVFDPAIDARGQFDPQSGSIILNPKSGNWMEKLGILLHENQHYLQEVEDFARGGNPQNMGLATMSRTANIDAYRKAKGEIESRAVQNPANIRSPAKDLQGRDIVAEQMKLEGIKPDEVIVRSGTGTSADALDPLIQEARKYKSAEEFVNGQQPIYHGTPEKFDRFDTSISEGNATWFTADKKDILDNTAGAVQPAGSKLNIMERYVKPDLKLATPEQADEMFTDQLIAEGYRGVKYPKGEYGDYEWTKLFNPNEDTVTKSQLTDIYNQAKGGGGIMADVGDKERGFITTLKDSPKTDPRVIDELEGAYIPQANKTTLKTAKDNLKKNFTGALARAVDLEGDLTPEGVVEGHLLIDMLSKKGDIEGAVSVAEALATKGTKQGQVIQAFSMWDRLTPEGMLTYAQRSINKANEGRGSIDKMLGRNNIKLDPNDAQEILETMQDAQKVPVNERGEYTKKALEVINKAIPPSASELFDAYRYEGMLSNLRTQLRNIHGNLLQTFVTKPITMAFETPFDWMQSTLFGTERKRYLSDVPDYYKDVVNSIPLGAEAFLKSMKGALPVDKPDLESVRKISGPVSRFMEGMDKFNQTIVGGAIKNDLMSKGMSEAEALDQANKQAEYWLFRQKADPKNKTGQGYLLSAVDKLSSSISGLPGRKWFIPFIQTPTNVAKQFLEFSPAGLATIPGNKNPAEQLAKTSAGTVAMLVGAKLAAEGKLSWAAPTDPEEKAIFYETRKPFSVKVGDTWVPMQYFGPFALALALPAAYDYYDKVEKKSLTSTQAQKAYNTILNSFQFMTNQTFLTGLNNYVQVLSGDPDYNFPSSAGFTATQAVPYSGLLRYISTIVDPTMRKSKRFMDSFYMTIPGMSENAFPYLDPTGQPVQRDPINYITPYDIKESDPAYERMYQRNIKTSQTDVLRNFSSRVRTISRDPTLSIEEKRSKILAEESKMKTARENINNLGGSQ